MAKVFIEESSLTAIGDAIREKTGETALLSPASMVTAIGSISGGGGADLPEEALTVTGNCGYRFANNGWNWLIENYGNKITTSNINLCSNMFYNSAQLEEIPFDLNFEGLTNYPFNSVFEGCEGLKSIGRIVNANIDSFTKVFYGCKNLRYLPEFVDCVFTKLHTATYGNSSYAFQNCLSLRSVPESLLKEMHSNYTKVSNSNAYCAFQYCYSLDEIRGLSPRSGTVTSNMFGSTFSYCCRLKDIIFDTQEDGTPYAANWKSQTIDLQYAYVGYSNLSSKKYITDYNSGITADKEVTDDASYQALKNDPGWYTTDVAYSRYNHDSAVNTINSLPDTSAYLATAGGTNTIKFLGDSGSATDGGAINTLTEEEIAVATAKGWTVTFG